MALQETLFPLTVSAMGSTIMWNTTVSVGSSGYEYRNANWQDPLQRWNAAFNVKLKSDIVTLMDFFNTVKGRETAFLVKDYMNYEVLEADDTRFTETVTGNSQEFQLYKRHSNALGTYYDRNIIKVDGSGVELTYDPDGTPYKPTYTSGSPTAGTEFSVDDTTGIVTYDPTGTEDIMFSVGEFYFPCRFDTDELPVNLLFHYVSGSTENAHGEIPDVPLVEVRI